MLLASSASGLLAQSAAPDARTAADRPAPFAAASASMNATAMSLRDSIVALARAQVGKRYVLGGASPARGFDCSGLVQYLAAALKLDVPRTAAEQSSRAGREVAKDPSRLRPGDLLTFGSGKRASHIGIYVGDGKFIHASTAAGRVVESRVDRQGRGIKPWRGVRRLLADTDSGKAGGAGG